MPVMGSSTAVIEWVGFCYYSKDTWSTLLRLERDYTLLILETLVGDAFAHPRFFTINAHQTFKYIHSLSRLPQRPNANKNNQSFKWLRTVLS